MYARVVRFTDVTDETVARIVARVEDSDGPPEGVTSTGMQLLVDSDQGTAVFVGYFANAEDLKAADEVFEAMDRGDTPGTRVSVDRCEVKIEREE